MISREQHPMGWALFLYELADAHEHLGQLLKDAEGAPDFSEEELRVSLGHVYAHLNRAWYRRNVSDDFPLSDWEAVSRFPVDIEPVG